MSTEQKRHEEIFAMQEQLQNALRHAEAQLSAARALAQALHDYAGEDHNYTVEALQKAEATVSGIRAGRHIPRP